MNNKLFIFFNIRHKLQLAFKFTLTSKDVPEPRIALVRTYELNKLIESNMRI